MPEATGHFHENGHEFANGSELGLWTLSAAFVCKQCGIVRRADGRNGQCRGRVTIGLREAATVETAADQPRKTSS